MKTAIASADGGMNFNRANGAPITQGTDPWWRERSACLSDDPELFFPEPSPNGKNSVALENQVAQAKAVCASCPVALECLSAAVTMDERFGIFGGKTAQERRALTTVPDTPEVLTVNGRLSSQATVNEFMHLYRNGASAEEIAKRLGKTLVAIEICFRRAKVKAPFSLGYQARKSQGKEPK